MQTQYTPAAINLVPDDVVLQLQGDWTRRGISVLPGKLGKLPWPKGEELILDGADLTSLDSAGAWLLLDYKQQLIDAGYTVKTRDFNPKREQLLNLVGKEVPKVRQPIKAVKLPNWLYRVGQHAENKWQQADAFLQFIGELALTILSSLRNPKRLQFGSLVATIEDTGYGALPIIALLSFLVGVVLTYQIGLELKIYGANAFIVNLTGMAILREFGPLITAIIVAGRTSSAYTAHIGTMKVNEELDALRTMGLSPITRLVVPRVFGLMIAMPLLVFWSDIFGVLGAMLMSKSSLDIGYYNFLQRFQQVVGIDNYYIGLVKAPVFALLIASVGCFQGFRTGWSADSVGHQTTRSVVQSLFLIIIADALFSIYFSWAGI